MSTNNDKHRMVIADHKLTATQPLLPLKLLHLAQLSSYNMTPDTIETLRNYALQRFVEEAIQLKEPRMGDTEQEPLLRYTSFVMTGLHPDNGTRTVVDPIQDRISPEELDNHVHAQRDIDSFNSLTDNLPFVNSISVYPVPRFDDALKKNCHLTFSIVVPGSVSTTRRPSYLNVYSPAFDHDSVEPGTYHRGTPS